MSFIPYGRQDIRAEDIDAVLDTLRSDFLTQGPAVARFEQAVRGHCRAAHALAVSNGTAALHLACAALGVGEGDRVWTSPNTFVASANCARYLNADVDFVDIDAATYNMSVEALAKKLADAERDGRLPKVIIPVHFSGQPCDMPAIRALAEEYGVRVIEDAAHALGATWKADDQPGAESEPVGSGRWSDLTTFSFHPVKIITSGEGGMVMSGNAELAQRVADLRTHGVTRDVSRMDSQSMDEARDGGWYYQQLELGWNYRITDIQSALGASQMKHLDGFVSRRRELAARYDRLLDQARVSLPFQRPEADSSWHLYVVRLRLDRLAVSRREVFDAMRAAQIGVHVMYIPVHTQPYYRQLGFRPGDFPEAERYYDEALALPLYPGMSDADQDRVVETLHRILV